jgi:DNA-binding winged helix-turn-helix (wHTH) protein
MVKINVVNGMIYSETDVVGSLNKSELAIVMCLIKNEGEVVSKDVLLSAGWPERVVVLNSVNVSIKNIRYLLGRVYDCTVIETVKNEGYKLHAGFIEILSCKDTEVADLNKKINKGVGGFKARKVGFYFVFLLSLIVAGYVFFLERKVACVFRGGAYFCGISATFESKLDGVIGYEGNGVFIYGVTPITGEGIYEKLGKVRTSP